MTERPTIKLVDLRKDHHDEFRFYGVATNDLIIVESSQGYENRLDAIGAIQGVFGEEMKIEENGREVNMSEQNQENQPQEGTQEGAEAPQEGTEGDSGQQAGTEQEQQSGEEATDASS